VSRKEEAGMVNMFFSSPDHGVLKLSYCDRSLSVVRTSVNNCLKKTSPETTWPNSMKLHRKLPWVSLYKTTTQSHDWLTTTIWPTSCFALEKHLF